MRRAIGARIRELRQNNKMTLEQLGDRADVSYQYLSAIENGKVNFSIDILDRIAQALECKVDDLLNEAD